MTGAAGVGLPEPWLALREAVLAEGRVLSQNIFERVRKFFTDQYAGGDRTAEDLTREYAREEFLLVVDDQGAATGISGSSLQAYRDTIARAPVFGKWFQEANLPGTGEALLAARWLCHLIGLRHRTVEIFIDPPHLEGHTLVQVRGMDKYEAPGAFDIPCAGHVSEADSAERALRKELAEELNLSIDDLSGVCLIARYNSYTVSPHGESLNNEYRFLYRARLKDSTAKYIRFADGEVAGLAVFSVPELRALVERFPERVASGLGDAMVYYA
jgi:8-oxo-dGTP pyrophosphatase MutT (NUDIX family)